MVQLGGFLDLLDTIMEPAKNLALEVLGITDSAEKGKQYNVM